MFEDAVAIHCLKCSKMIARVPYPGFRTVTSCAECDLQERTDAAYQQRKAQREPIPEANPIAAALGDVEVEMIGNIPLVKPKEKKGRKKKDEIPNS